MNFDIGTKVKLLNEVGTGEVVKVLSDEYFLVEVDGFEYRYNAKELIPLTSQASKEEQLMEQDYLSVKQTDLNNSSNKLSSSKPKNKVPELDLHWEHLEDIAPRHVSALDFQIHFFEASLKKHLSRGTKRLIVIHGKGEGKLKSAVRNIAENKYYCQCEDASLREYDTGATLLFLTTDYLS